MGDTVDLQLKRLQAKQTVEDERLSKKEIILLQMAEALAKIYKSDLGKGTTDDSRPEYKKPIRTDMPKFDGTNVQGWVYKAKKYLRYHNIPDEERITVAPFNMEGEALEWSLWADINNKIKSWCNFIDDVITRFGTSAYEIATNRSSMCVDPLKEGKSIFNLKCP